MATHVQLSAIKLSKLAALFLLSAILTTRTANSAPLYSNGFETDIAGWDAFGAGFDPTRVSSGTNSIPSASGGFHATNTTSGSAGNWGGYNYGAGNAVPTVFQAYRTSVDIYLDVSGGWANNTRVDFDSAINNSAGTFKRDFIFNAGFYNDATGPGASTNRFVISASNNSQPGSAYAKNPARDPIAISTTGWYTFEHQFYDNGGVLAVDLNIFDSSNSLVHSWTLSDPADIISGIGGNRYGWFDFNQFGPLAFDNSLLELTPASAAEVPEPASLALWGLVSAAGAAFGYRRRRLAKSAGDA